jgi:hypothetical protein
MQVRKFVSAFGGALVEQFIEGREITVLVGAVLSTECWVPCCVFEWWRLAPFTASTMAVRKPAASPQRALYAAMRSIGVTSSLPSHRTLGHTHCASTKPHHTYHPLHVQVAENPSDYSNPIVYAPVECVFTNGE